ncbi:hypothetical protein CUR178_07550 [Leishmania enriettii]|uniref:Uncharacterized protein n=1 Tax=Leishmania enriettii TaxID=5663 RepID=A0A836H310_LEIEN|nr:hypothetical protein CUR178_07550 [Leishmania enriettii]
MLLRGARTAGLGGKHPHLQVAGSLWRTATAIFNDAEIRRAHRSCAPQGRRRLWSRLFSRERRKEAEGRHFEGTEGARAVLSVSQPGPAATPVQVAAALGVDTVLHIADIKNGVFHQSKIGAVCPVCALRLIEESRV